MRRDAIFGALVHGLSSNLYFQRVAVIIDDDSMERLIKVVFRGGDVIIEFAGDRAPELMHETERKVTICDSLFLAALARL